MNEPAKKVDFTSNPQRQDGPRRVIDLRCKEPLQLGNDVRNHWLPGRSPNGSAVITSMEMLPMGVLVRAQVGAGRKAILVPYANVIWAGLEE